MIFDSNRTKDKFGRLTIKNCTLTGEDVAEYFGAEVPDYSKYGLDPRKVYSVYRPLDEIKKSDFTNTPLFTKHLDFSVDDFPNKFNAGTIGDSKIVGSEIKSTISLWKKEAIEGLDKGKKYLSCGYLYTPVVEKGVHNGKSYDIKMTDIHANHVALVDNPRYKKAMVADENSIKKGILMFSWIKGKEKNGSLTLDEAFEAHAQILANDNMTVDEKEAALKIVKAKVCDTEKEKIAKEKLAKKIRDEDDDEPVMDADKEDKKEDKEDKKPSKDSKTAKDSAIDIEALVNVRVAQAVEQLRKQSFVMDSALAQYERICGKANRMAFDSADTVLDTILKNNKKSIEGKTLAQKQAMVEMLPSINSYSPPKITLDSESTSRATLPTNLLSYLQARN